MTIQKVTYLSDLHFEHNQWLNELSFWEDEIQFFEKELEKVVQKWTDKSVLVQAEHFQNTFLVQQEGIHGVKHNIRQHEKELAHKAEIRPEEVEAKYFKNHDDMREGLDTQRKLFREMKKEFLVFLSKYM